jgi:D-alanyl-lipoteichoic acid acyltransferase DltB (MBOAT superfamily)
MLFNSLHFLLFFPVVCLLYWVLPQKFRNGLLLLAGYYFYISYKPIFAVLLLFSTVTTWLSGIYIAKSTTVRTKKIILITTLIANLLILFVFKYFGFLSTSINQLFDVCHIRMQLPTLYFLLPIGISFYTFQVIGYLVDVFRGIIKPERNFWTYALFVSFFPQLVAGPIERAKNLLPQFHHKHIFDGNQFFDGTKMMVWGYFMKLCIADRVAPYVDAVFNSYTMHNGYSLLLGTFFFSFQVFCDFAGYSLIAMGVAKCMGFNLMQNFNRPYLSPNIKTFWHRWHISLSTWLKDYLYIPLGGSRCGFFRHIFNLFITFVISGLWHGANWTFLAWGAIHGIWMVADMLKNRFLSNINIRYPLQQVVHIGLTFIVVMFAWVFFRAHSIFGAFIILKKIFTEHGMLYRGEGIPEILLALFCICILMFKEIKDEMGLNIHFIHNKHHAISVISLALMISFILLTAQFSGEAFIYFQF